MRTLDESKTRWEETLKQSSSFVDLQRAVKFNGPESPCVAGCRSVCWKAFLLFKDANAANWSHVLLENRNTYSTLREHYLKYIKHPELLNELSLDPLADDPDSPWTAVRDDESIRAEILQDVQRLPDEPFYHQESTQRHILDILFIWVKLNPDMGGYRQGMHELLAPLLYVVDKDAIDRKNVGDAIADPNMVEMLDSYFIEHDTFALFSKLMEYAKPFYEVSVDAHGPLSGEQSAIVEKSKMIHEVALMRIDPELATHLQATEILPQIFLIRWIRLLFGREFPFDQLLTLWDTIFAFDPTLDLIDLMCVAMLLRIRWTLLEADYTVALQVLLKYPAPEPPHGPHTFVDDAIYLRDHYSAQGGSSIIMKYTGKTPAPISDQGPSTPESKFQGLSIRSRAHGARSPLRSPSRFINQRGGVEALFQGAAKNVIERGEKLGINQAVRDAMGEIRRNMQDFQETRIRALNHSLSSSSTPRNDIFTNGSFVSPAGDEGRAIAELERRNKQLALLLDEAITGLEELSASKLEGDKEKNLEAVALATAKAQFVKVHLENSSLELPTDGAKKEETPPQVVVDDAVPSPVPAPAPTPTASLNPGPATGNINKATSPSLMVAEDEVMVDPETAGTPRIGILGVNTPAMEGIEQFQSPPAALLSPRAPLSPAAAAASSSSSSSSSSKQPEGPPRIRPTPIPTRSTMAQSSFTWMLEPDQSPSTSFAPSSTSPSSVTTTINSKKSPRDSASRERNAFLFGEVTTGAIADLGKGGAGGKAAAAFTPDDIFGLEPLKKPAKPRGKYEDLFGGALSED
ncbi:TBC1 domain family member 5 [Cytospora mali]|uniref:TBC1 domain family member 5 n=1 Tax=Cytospora mali TaxID=578113 RepID=A0A194V6T8_CYTMA|nr:TBC1 domain family member 5 [Valsa mali var. pyri (nom. inval.)]